MRSAPSPPKVWRCSSPLRYRRFRTRAAFTLGENAISHNLIMCNKANLLNQSSFTWEFPRWQIFAVKELIAFLMLHLDYAEDEILVCDPEGEFGALVKALGREKGYGGPSGGRRQRPVKRDVHGRGLRRTESHCREVPVCHVADRADRQAGRGAAAQVHHRPLYRPGVPGGGKRQDGPPPSATCGTSCWNSRRKGKGDRPFFGTLHHRLPGHLWTRQHGGFEQALCGV